MTDRFATLFDRAQRWLSAARDAGWCDEADSTRLAAVERGTPGQLFRQSGGSACGAASGAAPRPLVVALFGGTGVGKSSLLNRLAGAAVATTGVVRPTSRVATLYVHQAVALAQLPPDLPTERTQIARHGNERYRDVLLIDMPDVDSTERANRALVVAWLPHVDLVVYVVSPERYRDDVGWRVLRARGARHGWLFVLNRWDEGDATQRNAVATMLRDAGFDAPEIVCTSCAPVARPLPTPDEFPKLEGTIDVLARSLAVREFERLGMRARLSDFRRVLETLAARTGDDALWEQLERAWRARLATTCAAIQEGMHWPIEMHAARFSQRDASLADALLERAANAVRASAPGPANLSGSRNQDTSGRFAIESHVDGFDSQNAGPSAALPQLWDDWAQAKLASCVDALEVELRRREVSAEPVRRAIDPALANSSATMNSQIADELRARLGRPAGAARRALAKAAGALTWVLPLAALGVVAYQVVIGYLRAAVGSAPFLDMRFAVHSALLVLVAWCVPFILGRALRPGLQRVARRALENGLAAAIGTLQRELNSVLQACRADAATRRAELDVLLQEATAETNEPLIADMRRFVARQSPS